MVAGNEAAMRIGVYRVERIELDRTGDGRDWVVAERIDGDGDATGNGPFDLDRLSWRLPDDVAPPKEGTIVIVEARIV